MMLRHELCKRSLQICTSGVQRCAATYARSALQDHYQVLGVGRKATSSEIKSAFFNLSKKCHPDSDPSNPLLHAQFVRVNEAYKVLSKQASRKEYDQILEAIQRNSRAFTEQHPYRSSSRENSTTKTSNKEEKTKNWYSADDDSWYWSQFPSQSGQNYYTTERKERNRNIVLGCLFLVFSGIFMHFCVFSTLREIRSKEVEEQQKKILDFYNKTRDNARLNELHIQEVLIQRHEERMKQLYGQEFNAKK
ncbi:dnaJ homolog subfamily C member 4 [Pyxicephalus adspersus]|uniref:dnaJ homolog subfamily C member 4 n=1 Tax=Pyxicephalus adspersus TaxID=30357 RepID=UPI003B5A9722